MKLIFLCKHLTKSSDFPYYQRIYITCSVTFLVIERKSTRKRTDVENERLIETDDNMTEITPIQCLDAGDNHESLLISN